MWRVQGDALIPLLVGQGYLLHREGTCEKQPWLRASLGKEVSHRVSQTHHPVFILGIVPYGCSSLSPFSSEPHAWPCGGPCTPCGGRLLGSDGVKFILHGATSDYPDGLLSASISHRVYQQSHFTKGKTDSQRLNTLPRAHCKEAADT